ncbi:MAG: ABC transporter permease [Gaiellales bacterium]
MIPAIRTGIWLHLKQFTRDPFDIAGTALWPILYATIAYYLFDGKNDPELLLSASLGASVMLTWSMVVIASSAALERQRWQGTLELVVGAPVGLTTVITPITVASGLIGIYALVATLAWGSLLFGVPLDFAHPLAFGVSSLVCVVAVGMLGLIMAATFVLYRAAFHLGIASQYPMWIATGLLMPLSILPVWVEPISWVLSPSWGFRAMKAAALGGNPWPNVAMCVLLSVVYFVIGWACLRTFERVARGNATLRLT